MAFTDKQIKFMNGLTANLPAQSEEGVVYFTSDGHIHLGLENGKYKEYTDFHKVKNVTALPATQEDGLYYAEEENVLCIWGKKADGSFGWVQINPDHNTTYTIEQGTQNGTVKLVGSDGTSVEVAVKGLGSAAFTDADAYAPKTHTHTIEDVTGLADAVADAKKAGTDAQTAVETLEGKVGTVAEGKTVVQMIEDAKTASTYDDTALKGRVSTLEGSDAGKSARAIAAEETAKIVAGADAAYDTLKEVSDWISSHKSDASAMNSAILALEAIVDGIGGDGEKTTVVAYVTDAIAALKIGDYAKAADLTALAARVTTLEGKSHEHKNKELLDSYKQTEANLADAVAKKHEHANAAELAKIADGDKAKWDAAEQNAKDYADGLAGNYDAKGSANTALTNAKAYTDEQVQSSLTWGTF